VNGSSLRPQARRDAASVGVTGRELPAHTGLRHWRPKSLVIEFWRGCQSGVLVVWPRPPRPPPTGRFAAGALAARIVGGDVARNKGSPLDAGRYDTDAPFARAHDDNDGASAASALVRGDDVYWYNWDAALDSRETQRAEALYR